MTVFNFKFMCRCCFVPSGVILAYWDFLFWKQIPARIKMNNYIKELKTQNYEY